MFYIGAIIWAIKFKKNMYTWTVFKENTNQLIFAFADE